MSPEEVREKFSNEEIHLLKMNGIRLRPHSLVALIKKTAGKEAVIKEVKVVGR